MGVTVVVGGQFGSEGKGKVAQYLAQTENAVAAVRVGGSNSGHTAIDATGESLVLRQLPTAAVLPDVLCVLGPGSYIDIALLLREVEQTGLEDERLLIDRNAFIITDADRAAEANSDLQTRIGSTNSGTGASVARRIARLKDARLAGASPELAPWVGDASEHLRRVLKRGGRVVIEGTQGFGLSLLHSRFYPYTTSRDTSATGAVSETGLSPRDVDEVFLVIRAFPIRVAGTSGPLPYETTWEDVAADSGALNHVDYVDAACANSQTLTPVAREFVANAARAIRRSINYVGVGPQPSFLAGELPYAVIAS